MKNLILLLVLLATFSIQAKVEVLFHPYQDTFSAIVERLKQASQRIDLALYNIEVSGRSDIIKYLSSESVQERLQSGDLHIRLIFEGYASKKENMEKMLELEKLGIDVRTLASSKKMHHKFAVIDGHLSNAGLITGSANWSLGSLQNYNENILFFDDEGYMAQKFQKQFDYLWKICDQVGKDSKEKSYTFEPVNKSVGHVHFNTENFTLSGKTLRKKADEKSFHLTKKIVESIDNAKYKLEIASTRLKLRPIYNAIVRAAARGVKVKTLVTMGEYDWKSQRNKLKLQECKNEYTGECSSGVNYAALLNKENFKAHENIEVRLKFFHLKTSAYLNKQMHSKYIIIDDQKIITGSFNWSYSSEFNHIENIVIIDKSEESIVLEDFNKDFDFMWNQNRDQLSNLHQKITQIKKDGQKMNCSFEPMSLSFKEIDSLLRRGTKVCK